MNRLAYLPLCLLLLLAAAGSPATALPPFLAGDGCENYGNMVLVASDSTCEGGGDCENYGVLVLVDGSYTCSGDCPNHGVRVVVGGTMCGHGGNEVCVDNGCFPPKPTDALEAQAAAGSAADCLPSVHALGFPPSVVVHCDPSGEPCGINPSPVCWTTRYLCMNALVLVVNAYDNLVGQGGSSCEGQPDWGNAAAAVSS